jgi:hypothetical protein
MIIAEVYRRDDDSQVLGNVDGQGFYKYKTLKNFEKFVLNNPTHMLFHTYRNPMVYIKLIDNNTGKEIFVNKNY